MNGSLRVRKIKDQRGAVTSSWLGCWVGRGKAGEKGDKLHIGHGELEGHLTRDGQWAIG